MNKTNKYQFCVDQKVSIWVRDTIEINAENLEEAKKKLIKAAEEDNILAYLDGKSEYLFETEEIINPEENNNEATIEICEASNIFSPIWNNHSK